jgi:hypothetical protein
MGGLCALQVANVGFKRYSTERFFFAIGGRKFDMLQILFRNLIKISVNLKQVLYYILKIANFKFCPNN